MPAVGGLITMPAVTFSQPIYYNTTTYSSSVTWAPPPPLAPARPRTALDRLDEKVAATCTRARTALG
jgi:hypothetical protein